MINDCLQWLMIEWLMIVFSACDAGQPGVSRCGWGEHQQQMGLHMWQRVESDQHQWVTQTFYPVVYCVPPPSFLQVFGAFVCSVLTVCACGNDCRINVWENDQLNMTVFACDWMSDWSVEWKWLCCTGLCNTGWKAELFSGDQYKMKLDRG